MNSKHELSDTPVKETVSTPPVKNSMFSQCRRLGLARKSTPSKNASLSSKVPHESSTARATPAKSTKAISQRNVPAKRKLNDSNSSIEGNSNMVINDGLVQKKCSLKFVDIFTTESNQNLPKIPFGSNEFNADAQYKHEVNNKEKIVIKCTKGGEKCKSRPETTESVKKSKQKHHNPTEAKLTKVHHKKEEIKFDRKRKKHESKHRSIKKHEKSKKDKSSLSKIKNDKAKGKYFINGHTSQNVTNFNNLRIKIKRLEITHSPVDLKTVNFENDVFGFKRKSEVGKNQDLKAEKGVGTDTETSANLNLVVESNENKSNMCSMTDEIECDERSKIIDKSEIDELTFMEGMEKGGYTSSSPETIPIKKRKLREIETMDKSSVTSDDEEVIIKQKARTKSRKFEVQNVDGCENVLETKSIKQNEEVPDRGKEITSDIVDNEIHVKSSESRDKNDKNTSEKSQSKTTPLTEKSVKEFTKLNHSLKKTRRKQVMDYSEYLSSEDSADNAQKPSRRKGRPRKNEPLYITSRTNVQITKKEASRETSSDSNESPKRSILEGEDESDDSVPLSERIIHKKKKEKKQLINPDAFKISEKNISTRKRRTSEVYYKEDSFSSFEEFLEKPDEVSKNSPLIAVKSNEERISPNSIYTFREESTEKLSLEQLRMQRKLDNKLSQYKNQSSNEISSNIPVETYVSHSSISNSTDVNISEVSESEKKISTSGLENDREFSDKPLEENIISSTVEISNNEVSSTSDINLASFSNESNDYSNGVQNIDVTDANNETAVAEIDVANTEQIPSSDNHLVIPEIFSSSEETSALLTNALDVLASQETTKESEGAASNEDFSDDKNTNIDNEDILDSNSSVFYTPSVSDEERTSEDVINKNLNDEDVSKKTIENSSNNIAVTEPHVIQKTVEENAKDNQDEPRQKQDNQETMKDKISVKEIWDVIGCTAANISRYVDNDNDEMVEIEKTKMENSPKQTKRSKSSLSDVNKATVKSTRNVTSAPIIYLTRLEDDENIDKSLFVTKRSRSKLKQYKRKKKTETASPESETSTEKDPSTTVSPPTLAPTLQLNEIQIDNNEEDVFKRVTEEHNLNKDYKIVVTRYCNSIQYIKVRNVDNKGPRNSNEFTKVCQMNDSGRVVVVEDSDAGENSEIDNSVHKVENDNTCSRQNAKLNLDPVIVYKHQHEEGRVMIHQEIEEAKSLIQCRNSSLTKRDVTSMFDPVIYDSQSYMYAQSLPVLPFTLEGRKEYYSKCYKEIEKAEKSEKNKLEILKRLHICLQFKKSNKTEARKMYMKLKKTLQESLIELAATTRLMSDKPFTMATLLHNLEIPHKLVGYNEDMDLFTLYKDKIGIKNKCYKCEW